MQASTAAAAYAEAAKVSAAEMLSQGILTPCGAQITSTASAASSAMPRSGIGASAAHEMGSCEVSEEATDLQQSVATASRAGNEGVDVRGDVPQLLDGFSEPLYSPEALQLWLLQCCQLVCPFSVPPNTFYALQACLTLLIGLTYAYTHAQEFIGSID